MGERLATDTRCFAGTTLRITRRDITGGSDSDNEYVDPYFFDAGYTVAATTGFCRVWEGAEVLTKLLESGELRDRVKGKRVVELGAGQGLTLVHFSAQLEPCLAQENTQHTLNTPQHPLNSGYTTPTRTPYPIQSAQVEKWTSVSP